MNHVESATVIILPKLTIESCCDLATRANYLSKLFPGGVESMRNVVPFFFKVLSFFNSILSDWMVSSQMLLLACRHVMKRGHWEWSNSVAVTREAGSTGEVKNIQFSGNAVLRSQHFILHQNLNFEYISQCTIGYPNNHVFLH